METDQSRSEEPAKDDESVEEFKEEMENDPSRASTDETEDSGLDRLRGG